MSVQKMFGVVPYQGIVDPHSNESEWTSFKANKNNEAFIDRILRRDGALLPSHHRGKADLSKAAARRANSPMRLARPHTETLWRSSRS